MGIAHRTIKRRNYPLLSAGIFIFVGFFLLFGCRQHSPYVTRLPADGTWISPIADGAMLEHRVSIEYGNPDYQVFLNAREARIHELVEETIVSVPYGEFVEVDSRREIEQRLLDVLAADYAAESDIDPDLISVRFQIIRIALPPEVSDRYPDRSR